MIVLFLTAVVITNVSCALSTRDGIYLLPEGFTGGVVILFDQPDGIVRSVEDGRLVYAIPDEGILKVQGPPRTGLVSKEYYFVSKRGDRKRIRYLQVTGETSPQGLPQSKFGDITQDDHDNTLFVMNAGGFGSFRSPSRTIQYTSFVVSTPQHNSKVYSELQDRIFEIQKTFTTR